MNKMAKAANIQQPITNEDKKSLTIFYPKGREKAYSKWVENNRTQLQKIKKLKFEKKKNPLAVLGRIK